MVILSAQVISPQVHTGEMCDIFSLLIVFYFNTSLPGFTDKAWPTKPGP